MDRDYWRLLVAQAIRAELAQERQTPSARSSFVARLASVDPALNDPRNLDDPSLNAAWNFADSFFSAVEHGFGDLDGIPIAEARKLLVETAGRLEADEPIRDERVLRYLWPRRTKHP
jgi:hypothetical protein